MDGAGEIVTTGRTLDREAGASHALEVQASDGTLASTARLAVRLLDVNDHAPAFAQRFYDIRVPAPLAPPAPPAPRLDALPQVRRYSMLCVRQYINACSC